MFEKKHQNSGTLGKDTINKWIISFLSVGKRGFKSNFDLASIFLLILKRLKQGYNGENFQLRAILKKENLQAIKQEKNPQPPIVFFCVIIKGK